MNGGAVLLYNTLYLVPICTTTILSRKNICTRAYNSCITGQDYNTFHKVIQCNIHG